ncbi:MAG: protein-ADP-ribose hydrolase [Clostridia bacterium]|nr:protein-ADP-ribose hydrolase [Clostridia bacterium]
MDQRDRCLFLIRELLREMPEYRGIVIPDGPADRWRLLRGLMNVRPPMPATEEFLEAQDAFLREMTREKGVVDASQLPPCRKDERLTLWQGDITTLKCDAIVNAANSQLLGCFSPCHGCIDNIIHTMAGVQLRLKCDEIMRAQGHEEPTGQAKITPGYDLPCGYVLHTVGPIVDGLLTKEHERLLASCYSSCLELAAENGCESVAFCCISTGVFRFPPARAAEIAVETVTGWLDRTGSGMRVVFNVYKSTDREIYARLLN